MVRRIFMLMLGVSLGYFLGFNDAREHERTVVGRVVERVQGVAESTVGRHQEKLEEAATTVTP